MGNPTDYILRRKKAPRLPDSDNVLVSGESAMHSGLYMLEHNARNIGQAQEEIFVRKGTILPPCRDCGNPLIFRLVRKMDYVAEDPDFR